MEGSAAHRAEQDDNFRPPQLLDSRSEARTCSSPELAGTQQEAHGFAATDSQVASRCKLVQLAENMVNRAWPRPRLCTPEPASGSFLLQVCCKWRGGRRHPTLARAPLDRRAFPAVHGWSHLHRASASHQAIAMGATAASARAG